MRHGRLPRAVVVALVAALTLCASAAADKEKVQIVAADQAIAKSALVRLGDLGNVAGWSGGPMAPSPPSSFTCGTYTAKQSDLVLTGNASAKWTHPGLQFDSESQVLRTARMVDLDWQRTVTHAGVVECLRGKFASGLPNGQKLVSFAPLSFPKVAEHTAAFRALVDVAAGTTTVRVLVDVVVFGAGRVELTLITTAPYSARAPVESLEARLARVMVARALPGSA